MTAALTKYSLFSSTSLASTVSSSSIDVGRLIYGSVSLWWTGTPTGTLTVEAQNGTEAPWIAVSGYSQATGGASGSVLWLFTLFPYEKVRITYTSTSGTGALNGCFVAKGY